LEYKDASPEILSRSDKDMNTKEGNPKVKSSKMLLENPRVNWFPHYMALNVLITKDAIWVNLVCDLREVVEVRIKFPERIWAKTVSFGPMGTPLVASNDILEGLEQLSIGDIEAIWSF
jgi:hypothetical protein